MSIFGWLIVGIASGILASRLDVQRRNSMASHVTIGIGGAVFGGTAFHFFGNLTMAGFDIFSVVSAVVGATIAQGLYLTAMRASKDE